MKSNPLLGWFVEAPNTPPLELLLLPPNTLELCDVPCPNVLCVGFCPNANVPVAAVLPPNTEDCVLAGCPKAFAVVEVWPNAFCCGAGFWPNVTGLLA